MSLTRRNAILGLGTLAAGGAVIAGSGAFTTVDADRDVTVEFADDSDAVLAMEPAADYIDNDHVDISEGDDGEITISLLQINRTAELTFSELVQFTNNGTQTVESLSFTIEEDEDNHGSLDVTGDIDGDHDDMPLSPGTSVDALGLTVDTRDVELPENTEEITMSGTITISAET